jgi:protein TonB
VQKIEINRSSGHKVLDDAARRIVQMASPYAAFPQDIRRDTDIIEITRTWAFTRHDALETR